LDLIIFKTNEVLSILQYWQ